MSNIHCPVCGCGAEQIRILSSTFLRDHYEKYFRSSCESLHFQNYTQIRCIGCGLEFCLPMEPGDNNFYEWITNSQSYYPTQRWEWQVVRDKIASAAQSDGDLLEVGCGAGDFLNLIKISSQIHGIGLDPTQPSVDKCRENGLEVYCETMQQFSQRAAMKERRFDYAVAFHCLEHVPDPKGLVAEMASFLKPGGSLFLSTPCSPMCFENQWFDPLNHPPHHLTRWNESSYRALAEQLGMDIRFTMSPSRSLLGKMQCSLALVWFGPFNRPSKAKLIASFFMHPITTFREFLYQYRRSKLIADGQPVGDTVLVELVSREK